MTLRPIITANCAMAATRPKAFADLVRSGKHDVAGNVDYVDSPRHHVYANVLESMRQVKKGAPGHGLETDLTAAAGILLKSRCCTDQSFVGVFVLLSANLFTACETGSFSLEQDGFQAVGKQAVRWPLPVRAFVPGFLRCWSE